MKGRWADGTFVRFQSCVYEVMSVQATSWKKGRRACFTFTGSSISFDTKRTYIVQKLIYYSMWFFFPLKHYVWRFLYQNFMGLGLVVWQKSKFEVRQWIQQKMLFSCYFWLRKHIKFKVLWATDAWFQVSDRL